MTEKDKEEFGNLPEYISKLLKIYGKEGRKITDALIETGHLRLVWHERDRDWMNRLAPNCCGLCLRRELIKRITPAQAFEIGIFY